MSRLEIRFCLIVLAFWALLLPQAVTAMAEEEIELRGLSYPEKAMMLDEMKLERKYWEEKAGRDKAKASVDALNSVPTAASLLPRLGDFVPVNKEESEKDDRLRVSSIQGLGNDLSAVLVVQNRFFDVREGDQVPKGGKVVTITKSTVEVRYSDHSEILEIYAGE